MANKEETKEFKKIRGFKRYNQDFNKEKITLKKAGKEFNVYDWIQENREDTEIIPTLKKYGCIPVQSQDTAAMYQDFTNASDLRGVLDKKIAAEQAFYNLPVEVRREFDHDIDKFMKKGEKYIKDKIEKEKAEKEKLNPKNIEISPVENNTTTNTNTVTGEK